MTKTIKRHRSHAIKGKAIPHPRLTKAERDALPKLNVFVYYNCRSEWWDDPIFKAARECGRKKYKGHSDGSGAFIGSKLRGRRDHQYTFKTEAEAKKFYEKMKAHPLIQALPNGKVELRG
jgi:hypothetical protein